MARRRCRRGCCRAVERVPPLIGRARGAAGTVAAPKKRRFGSALVAFAVVADVAVPRWQMALFPQRVAALLDLDTTTKPSGFVDLGILSRAAQDAIGWLQATEITTGPGGNNFLPNANVTRPRW